MHRELRASKRNRKLFAGAIALCSGLALATALAPPNSTSSRLGPVVICTVLTAICVIALVSNLRFRVFVDEPWIAVTDLTETRRICLDAVQRVKWQGLGSSYVRLYDGNKSLLISFDELEHEDSLTLITWLRGRLPEEIHEGWDLFCLRVALPLQKSALGVNKQLAAGETMVTRRSFDRFILVCVASAFVILAVTAVATQTWEPIGVGLVTPIVLLMRFTVPKEGFRAQRLSAALEEFPGRGILWAVAVSAVVWLLAWQVWDAWAATYSAVAVCGASVLLLAYRAGERQQAAMEIPSQGADAEWRNLLDTPQSPSI